MKLYRYLGLNNKTRIKRFDMRKPFRLNATGELRRKKTFLKKHGLTESRNTIEID